MENREIFKALKWGSTFTLILLFFITYGTYMAHYLRRQTFIINAVVVEEDKISTIFINSFMVLSYVSLVLLIGSLFVAEDHPVATMMMLLNLPWMIMLAVWGFTSREAVNNYCKIDRADERWFHGFGAVFFAPFYFNYKVNSIADYG
jgi:hypothetical protein